MIGPERKYLIRKQGCYYRPNERGYTTSAIQAGRYTRDEAEKITHPNGKDGPRDGMSVIHEDELLGIDEDWTAYSALLADRRDPAVLAALPEVQAMIAAAYEVRPALTAPRDGTLVRLLLDYSEEENWVQLEDKIQAWTIGYNTLADTGDDEWIIVGWDWSQDCWCEGSGKIIGWLPFVPQATADATAALARIVREAEARGMRRAAAIALRKRGEGDTPDAILARAAEIERDGK